MKKTRADYIESLKVSLELLELETKLEGLPKAPTVKGKSNAGNKKLKEEQWVFSDAFYDKAKELVNDFYNTRKWSQQTLYEGLRDWLDVETNKKHATKKNQKEGQKPDKSTVWRALKKKKIW